MNVEEVGMFLLNSVVVGKIYDALVGFRLEDAFYMDK